MSEKELPHKKASGGLLNDPLAGNEEARYWRRRAIEFQERLDKALRADLKTRAEMRKAYETEFRVPRPPPFLSGAESSSGWHLSMALYPSQPVPLQKSKRGRPPRKTLSGLLAPHHSSEKSKPGRPVQWTDRMRTGLLDYVDAVQAAATPERKTAKDVLYELLVSCLGKPKGWRQKRQYEGRCRQLQVQLSKARKLRAD